MVAVVVVVGREALGRKWWSLRWGWRTWSWIWPQACAPRASHTMRERAPARCRSLHALVACNGGVTALALAVEVAM